MERVIDVDGVCEVDFLSGDDDYKRDWMSHRRERHGIVVFNPRTVWGALAAIRHVGGGVLKKLRVRSSPQVTRA
jgi:CelD/BcsL family acetyltransferase involved in cellulose biosynthesis